MSNLIIIGDAIIKDAPETIADLIKRLTPEQVIQPATVEQVPSILRDTNDDLAEANAALTQANNTLVLEIQRMREKISRLGEVIDAKDEELLDRSDYPQRIEELEKELEEAKAKSEAETQARIETVSGFDKLLIEKEEQIGELKEDLTRLERELREAELVRQTMANMPVEHFLLTQMFRELTITGDKEDGFASGLQNVGGEFRSGQYHFSDSVLNTMFEDAKTAYVVLKDKENVLIFIRAFGNADPSTKDCYDILITTPRATKKVFIDTKHDEETEAHLRSVVYPGDMINVDGLAIEAFLEQTHQLIMPK